MTTRNTVEEQFKELALELERQSQTFAAFFSAVPDYLYTFDRGGRFTFANRALLGLWGLTSEEALGKTMADLSYPSEVETILLDAVRHVFATGETVQNVTHYTSPTGTRGAYDNVLAPVLDGDGHVVMVAGLSRDISESCRARQALESSERKYKSLFMNLTEASALLEAVIDDDGVPVDLIFLEVNPAFGALAGVRSEDLVGQRLTSVGSGAVNDLRAWIDRLGEVALTGEPAQFEDQSRASGKWYSVSAISSEQGKLVTLVSDVSKRRSAEQALQRSEERYRAIADRLQGALLAIPDAIDGIDFVHAYHSSTEVARVGGDFYDIFELDYGLLGITIGDIAGKGIEAAVLTSLVKNSIRAHAAERRKTPVEVISLTNDLIYKATEPEAFATVFFAILDRRDGRMVYVNAGHCPAVVIHSDGTSSQLSITGPFLGAALGAGFEQREVHLDIDDMLFLYTDGLSEARQNGFLYGENRVLELLADVAVGSELSAVVEEIVYDVLAFSGGKLHDDLAMMAVRRHAHSEWATSLQQKLDL